MGSRMRENLKSGSKREELGTMHDIRIIRHIRGNPETRLRRNLNRGPNSSTHRMFLCCFRNRDSACMRDSQYKK
jgi:hypothetical protein